MNYTAVANIQIQRLKSLIFFIRRDYSARQLELAELGEYERKVKKKVRKKNVFERKTIFLICSTNIVVALKHA